MTARAKELDGDHYELLIPPAVALAAKYLSPRRCWAGAANIERRPLDTSETTARGH
jgi:hypothetical protein